MDSEEEKEEKTMVDIDVRDIDKVVFNGEPKRDSNVTYQEEESYVNPSNLSMDKYHCRYQSIEESRLDQDTIKINQNDVNLLKLDEEIKVTEYKIR
mmetsp:Transcript_39595/g.38138  ORF Transcript_39595/g.38138 Transcript_39595/m.38138 type:complete len:96 (-) Transcript_39595:438-725(-)